MGFKQLVEKRLEEELAAYLGMSRYKYADRHDYPQWSLCKTPVDRGSEIWGQILYYGIGCDREQLWLVRCGLTLLMRIIT